MAGVNSSQARLEVKAALAEAQRLQIDRKYRSTSGLFYIEGIRNFVQAMDNRFDIATILFSEKLLTAPLARKLVRHARRNGVASISLTPEEFRKISYSERASGVAAIASQNWSKLSDISPQAGLCWIVLEKVRSQGNLGTLIRTSEAVGGAGFIFVGKDINPFEPDVVRASMGAIFHQTFVQTDLNSLRRWMRHHSCHAIGASPDGQTQLHQFHYPTSPLLFLGEERQGLTPQQRELCQDLIKIPMVGNADSLNLAVAGSLLMYEIYRTSAQVILNPG